MPGEPSVDLFSGRGAVCVKSDNARNIEPLELGTDPVVKSYRRGSFDATACGPSVGWKRSRTGAV